MIVAAGTLELYAEKGLRNRFNGVFRSAAPLSEVHRAVLVAVAFRLEQFANPFIVRAVFLEAGAKPGLEARTAIGLVTRRVATEEEQVPDVALMPGEARVGKEFFDELLALVRFLALEECNGLFVGRDDTDEVERHAAEELRIGAGFGGRDLLALPRGAHLGVDDVSQRFRSPTGGGKRDQSENANR